MNILKSILCIPLVFGAGALCQATHQSPAQEEINSRVVQIVDENVREGVTNLPNGIVSTTRVPMSTEALNEIKSYGPKAIPELTMLLHSTSDRQQGVALRCLAVIGGVGILPAIDFALAGHTSEANRLIAAEALGQIPGKAAERRIAVLAKSDHSPLVRKRATEIIAERLTGTNVGR